MKIKTISIILKVQTHAQIPLTISGNAYHFNDHLDFFFSILTLLHFGFL